MPELDQIHPGINIGAFFTFKTANLSAFLFVALQLTR